MSWSQTLHDKEVTAAQTSGDAKKERGSCRYIDARGWHTLRTATHPLPAGSWPHGHRGCSGANRSLSVSDQMAPVGIVTNGKHTVNEFESSSTIDDTPRPVNSQS